MTGMTILTPSYRPDLAYLIDLHRSILQFAPENAVHHIVVPSKDVRLFSKLASDRAVIHSVGDFLPRNLMVVDRATSSIARVPGAAFAGRVQVMNLKAPWPPIRGWIVQQLVKLAAVASFDAQAVVIVDSDVAFVRPWAQDRFVDQGAVRFYRNFQAVTETMDRHVGWHRVAHDLLGIDAPPSPPLTDYISALLAWSPEVVRALQRRIEVVTGESWSTAIGRNLHFSEYILYGCFLEHFGSAQQLALSTSDSMCAAHWDAMPLTMETANKLSTSIRPGDIAVQIQSTSQTPIAVRRAVLATSRAAIVDVSHREL